MNTYPHKIVKTVWEVWEYNVWGNSSDGYDVNDKYHTTDITVTLPVRIANENTNLEFSYAELSNRQIKRLFNLGKMKISVDGDDVNYYVNREKDDFPLFELRCISHVSLSPIRKI